MTVDSHDVINPSQLPLTEVVDENGRLAHVVVHQLAIFQQECERFLTTKHTQQIIIRDLRKTTIRDRTWHGNAVLVRHIEQNNQKSIKMDNPPQSDAIPKKLRVVLLAVDLHFLVNSSLEESLVR